MFRATLCSSSGGQLYEYNFWYNHSVLVVSWGWAHSCSKHVEDLNKLKYYRKIVRQVGHLPELYEDARSEKY
jgi:hypothetical protein